VREDGRVILSVTTLRDSLANVEKLVRRNLRGGIDHLVLFLDHPSPDIEEALAGHPHVTAVRAYDDWWTGSRPDDLNERQVCNHGLASRLFAGMRWAEWVFALDGDEVAQLDRTVLDRLDPAVRAVQLRPLEAVSRMNPAGDPTQFKRLPSKEELVLLQMLGVIRQRRLRGYFRGHVSGKPGLRVGAGYALGVHHVVDTATGERLEPVRDPGLTLLHYESHNGQEFVRKWKALLGSGVAVRQHANRSPVARSVATILDRGQSEEETAEALERLYRETALDDVETLQRLTLLVEVDPDQGTHTPRSDPQGVGQLRTLLDRARPVPKPQFRPRVRDRKVDKVVAKLQRRL
jgi:hypothetical protein